MASGEIWLGTCILTAYVLSNILMSKMIYYYFICRSKMKKKKDSHDLTHMLNSVVTSKMMG